jgi:hypothetical protein
MESILVAAIAPCLNTEINNDAYHKESAKIILFLICWLHLKNEEKAN